MEKKSLCKKYDLVMKAGSKEIEVKTKDGKKIGCFIKGLSKADNPKGDKTAVLNCSSRSLDEKEKFYLAKKIKQKEKLKNVYLKI